VPALSIARLIKLVGEVRDGGIDAPALCVVGEGQALADVAGALSEGAGDTHDGLSVGFDLLPADGFPRDSGWRGAGTSSSS
jgi:hypothetical protein